MAGNKAGIYSYNMADAYAYEHGTATLASGEVTVTTGLDFIDVAFADFDSAADANEFLSLFVTKNSGANGDLKITASKLVLTLESNGTSTITHTDSPSAVDETVQWVAFGNKHTPDLTSQS